jgi:hypothetical protein
MSDAFDFQSPIVGHFIADGPHPHNYALPIAVTGLCTITLACSLSSNHPLFAGAFDYLGQGGPDFKISAVRIHTVCDRPQSILHDT